MKFRMKAAILQAADYLFDTMEKKQRFPGCGNRLQKTGPRWFLLFSWNAMQKRGFFQEKLGEGLFVEQRRGSLSQTRSTGCTLLYGRERPQILADLLRPRSTQRKITRS